MKSFIDEQYINTLLETTATSSEQAIRAVLDKAKLKKGLNHQDVAILLNITNEDDIKELHAIAYDIKKSFYGDRVVLFAPLYLSNYCVNNCTYCGYRRDNDFERKKLTLDELALEVKSLEALGHKRIALEVGEDQVNVSLDYILAAIKKIYASGDIRRINVNIAATTKEDYQRLAQVDIGTYILFQETYHQPTYEKLHPQSLKGDYLRQLYAHHNAMEAGIEDVGGGVLFGLANYRFDLLALLIHNEQLYQDFGVEFHTLSVPRLKKAHGVNLEEYPHIIDDATFINIVSILRVATPHVGIILSTREDKEMRELLIKQGVSQISANSKTTVGGYTTAQEIKQFEVGDERSLLETMKDLIKDGNLPSYCTACYRMGRTGKEFHEYVETQKIASMCHPNAILTTLEYILDSGDEEIKEIGIPFLLNQITLIKDQQIKELINEYFIKIQNSARDLYI
ncbi:MAG: [FeFe] hydrogenase H-cluster radical SAM maturase HydG [Bacilli bacterium]